MCLARAYPGLEARRSRTHDSLDSLNDNNNTQSYGMYVIMVDILNIHLLTLTLMLLMMIDVPCFYHHAAFDTHTDTCIHPSKAQQNHSLKPSPYNNTRFIPSIPCIFRRPLLSRTAIATMPSYLTHRLHHLPMPLIRTRYCPCLGVGPPKYSQGFRERSRPHLHNYSSISDCGVRDL